MPLEQQTLMPMRPGFGTAGRAIKVGGWVSKCVSQVLGGVGSSAAGGERLHAFRNNMCAVQNSTPRQPTSSSGTCSAFHPPPHTPPRPSSHAHECPANPGSPGAPAHSQSCPLTRPIRPRPPPLSLPRAQVLANYFSLTRGPNFSGMAVHYDVHIVSRQDVDKPRGRCRTFALQTPWAPQARCMTEGMP